MKEAMLSFWLLCHEGGVKDASFEGAPSAVPFPNAAMADFLTMMVAGPETPASPSLATALSWRTPTVGPSLGIAPRGRGRVGRSQANTFGLQ